MYILLYAFIDISVSVLWASIGIKQAQINQKYITLKKLWVGDEMEMSGMMGSFFRVSEWLMKFLLANLVWLIFNFPLVYLLLSMLNVTSTEELQIYLIVIIILLPVIFFPATMALFGVVRKWINAHNNERVIYHFWKYYKENYFRSIIGGVIYVALWVLWIVNYNLSGAEIGSGMFYFYLAITIFLLAFTNYFFADAVHYDIGLFKSLKKVLFMVVFHIQYTLGAAAAVGISFYIIYQIHPVLLLLFSGSVMAYIYFFAFHQIFLRAQGSVTSTPHVMNTESLQ